MTRVIITRMATPIRMKLSYTPAIATALCVPEYVEERNLSLTWSREIDP